MNKHHYVAIMAGGIGSRFWPMSRTNLPKQFLPLKGKPLLYYTLKTFSASYPDLQIILVVPAEYMTMAHEITAKDFDKDRIRITTGGETRFQSVKNGLALVNEESIIFVHDGVRCLLSTDLIHRCYETALATGSAIPVVTSKDSVRLLKEEHSEPLDRNRIVFVQTPQTFHSKILLPAFQVDYKEKFTDEATVVINTRIGDMVASEGVELGDVVLRTSAGDTATGTGTVAGGVNVGYTVLAVPITINQTGIRGFCAEEDAVVRVDPAGKCSAAEATILTFNPLNQ